MEALHMRGPGPAGSMAPASGEADKNWATHGKGWTGVSAGPDKVPLPLGLRPAPPLPFPVT